MLSKNSFEQLDIFCTEKVRNAINPLLLIIFVQKEIPFPSRTNIFFECPRDLKPVLYFVIEFSEIKRCHKIPLNS